MSNRLPLWITLLALTAGVLRAQDSALIRTRQAAVDTDFRERIAHHGTDTNWMVRRGLLASRTGGWVRVQAAATGIAAHAPVEFFLITEPSGKDYEALAVAFCRAQDIHAALEFLGMTPGRPVDRGALQFWPKGERVDMRFRWRFTDTNGVVQTGDVPAEHMIWDTRREAPMSASGMLFTGSLWQEAGSGDAGAGRRYAADEWVPQAIAATYNESTAVLDLPRQSPQSEVYTSFLPNSAYSLPAGTWLEIELRPRNGPETPRVCDLELVIRPAGGTGPACRFDLLEPGGRKGAVAATDLDLTGLLATFGRITEAGRDPYVTLAPSGALTLAAWAQCCKWLESLDVENGIRIEAPLPGQVYYRAFLPDEKQRDRAGRIVQPRELRLTVTNGTVQAAVTRIDEHWGDAPRPELSVQETSVSGPEEAVGRLCEPGATPLVFVFAGGAVPLSALDAYLAPLVKAGVTVYVYLE